MGDNIMLLLNSICVLRMPIFFFKKINLIQHHKVDIATKNADIFADLVNRVSCPEFPDNSPAVAKSATVVNCQGILDG